MSSSVIECPSCNTKFAVNLHLDSSLEPLFHCSRCGHYFRQETKAKQLDLIDSSTQFGITKEFNQNSNQEAKNIKNEIFVNSSSNINSINEELEQKLEKPSFGVGRDSSEITTQKVEWPKPKYYFGDGQFNADELDTEEIETDEIDTDELNANILDSGIDPNDESLALYAQSKKGSIFNSDFSRQFAIFCLLPLILTLCFCAWAYNIDKTPSSITNFFNLDSKSLATIAPAGLELSALKPEILTLDSGKKAFLIKGEVINSTTHSFKNIMIEAKLFTKENTELVRLIAPLDSKLRDAKNLQALQVNNLLELQSDLSSDKTTVTPNLKIPFSVVIPEIKGNETWYSARVYSVNSA